MKKINIQYFIMLFMVTTAQSIQLTCSDFSGQITIVPQEIIYSDETEDDDELNTAVIYGEDEITEILDAIGYNDLDEDINDISSINSFNEQLSQ